jgi:FKBP-type peptidyl-prolyl cis-trans isomerase
MKKTALFILLSATVSVINAQPGKTTPTKPATKPVAKPVNPFKNSNDSISYVLGESAAFYLSQQGFTDIKLNNALFTKGLNDILGKKGTLIDDVTANNLLNSYMMKVQAQKSQPAIAAGQKCQADNKLKPGIITTPSGLQYQVLTQGSGAKATSPEDSVTCHYRGTFINGEGFDNSYDRGAPITFALNKVIPGWTEGLQLMTVGSKYKFWIPYTLGYGAADYMSIPGGSLLIFEVELLDVKKKQ